MADVSYESLQSQIEEQKGKIATQREFIGRERIAGVRGIEATRRVHPRTPASIWFGERKPRMESLRGRLGELETAEKELGIAETKLRAQETLLAKRKAEGYKIRRTDGEFEFYKEIPAVAVGAPRGDFSVRVRWGIPDPNTGEIKEENIKTVLGRASKLESMQQQIADRGGIVLEVESLGGGRYLRTPEMRTTTGGSFLLYEAPPIIKKPIKTMKEIEIYTSIYERIPEINILKKRMITPIEFAEIRGVPREIFIEKEKAESKFWRETIPKEAPEMHYLLGFAEKPQIKGLRSAIISGDEGQIKSASEAAYESLTASEKETYGFKFQPFKEESLETWKYYPGGLKYLKSLTVEQREELISKEYNGIEGFKKGLTSEEILEVAHRYAAKGGIYGGPIDEKFWREYAWEQLIKTPTERRELYYGRLPAPVRWYSAAFKAAISTAAFPIILPQTVVKYIRGKGPLLDPLGRIQIGKPLILPDIAAEIHKYTPPAPSGALGIAISETMGWATGREIGEWERAKKYPIEAAFATAGEITGLLVGGKIIGVGRVAVARGLERLKVPAFPLRYRPTMLVRRAYWEARIKLGIARKVPPEVIFRRGALPSGLAYAPGRTISERIMAVEKAFARTKVVTAEGEKLLVGVHTTAKLWFKPIVLLRKGREVPGVSFAPFGEAAPRFLRITGRITAYETRGISLFPRFRFPTAPILYFRQLEKVPRFARISYEKAAAFIKRKPGVYVAPKLYLGGAEYEAIARGIAQRLGVRFVTKIKGVAVPLPEFRLIEKATGSILKQAVSSTKRFLAITSEYGAPPTIPLITPGYIIAQISKISYPSIPSIPSVPSVPSVPSIPSYPSIPSIPSVPSVPSVPSIPSIPSIPSVPSVPSIPSYPSIPSIPSIPSVPSIPSYPIPSIPSIPSVPSVPSVPSIPYPSIPYISPPPSRPPVFVLPDTTYKMFGHTMGQGYNVKIKERHIVKGKKIKEPRFLRINKRPLSLRDAEALRGMVLDNSAAASGKIVPVNAMAQEPLIDLKPFEDIEHKFYMKDDILIEKRKHRIDTKGEVQGISALGWYAERTKKAAKKREVVARRPRAKVIKEPVDMFDMDMDDMLINIDKIFKGVFNFGF